jgi:lipid-binding SYLF domain-containing protein
MMFSKRMLLGLAAMAALALCWPMAGARAGAYEIEADSRAALDKFFYQVPSSRELANKAAGILVFPMVVKAGFGVGGEYGEGTLFIGGKAAGYYNDVAGSFGFQFGAQARSIVIMFMTRDALDKFHHRDGWKVGVDGSVAIVAVGAGGTIDTNTIQSPVVGFIYDQKGLMYNLTLEGSKITRIYR